MDVGRARRPRWGAALFESLVVRFGSVVHLIIWVTLAAFVLQLLGSFARVPWVEEFLALSGAGLRRGMIWQPLTYMFLHDTGNLLHILLNLLILWFIGREVEYFIGAPAFARLYLLGGLTGAVVWLCFNFFTAGYLLGASAAVLATVIAFATLFPDREVTFLVFFVLPVRLKARVLALILIAFDIVPLLARTDTHIAHLAHLGGALVGYVYIKYLGYGLTPRWWQAIVSAVAMLRPRRRRPRLDESPEDFIREQVDPILDKIAREGIHSLTRRERKILESAKDHLRHRQSR